MQIRDLIELLQQRDPTEEIQVEIVAHTGADVCDIQGEIDRLVSHPGRHCAVLEVF